MPQEESICIEDFCGRGPAGHNQTSFSADYWPADRMTYFNGDWYTDSDIPPMPSDRVPTIEEVYAWAISHGSKWSVRHLPPQRT